ncbi:MAG: hypothetical protein IID41_07865 [Planctomycetes bacterium]|nr:hypothetical protein [Planctomycetota bacterium]
MATVVKDTLTTLEIVETHGIIWELRREILVHDLDASVGDFRVLNEALVALTDAGFFPLSPPETLFADLVLIQRLPALIPGEQTKVRVELIYEQFGRSLDSLSVGAFIWSGGGSLKQIATEKDRFGNPLLLGYTYPPVYPLDESLQGKFVPQGGSAQVDNPNDTTIAVGRLTMPNPDAMVDAWRGWVNSDIWRAGAAGTWLCTDVQYDTYHQQNITWPIYNFRFTFQREPQGWNPLIVFRDPRSGKPAANWWDQPSASQLVDWYPPRPFVTFPN